MGKFWYKMEYKYGKYAIRNLPLILIICYGIGYVLEITNTGLVDYLALNPYHILHGQIWRLVTWVLIPPEGLSFWTIIMLYFYYSVGKDLENTWGSFRFNIYVFSGMIFTILGSFVLYGIAWVQFADVIESLGAETVFTEYASIQRLTEYGMETVNLPSTWFLYISTYYINLGLLLAFAATYPNVQVMLMGILPIRVKVLGILYGVIMLYNFVLGDMAGRVVILASLLNFIIFFFSTRGYARVSPGEIKRKQDYRRKVREAKKMGNETTYQGRTVITRHKCAICGRTELDDETLEFRYCSKCEGNYEYCMEHLYTHEHVRRIVPGEKGMTEEK